MRPSWVEIDLRAIGRNVAAVAGVVGTGVCAVVKADAYGHGDVPVAEAALDAGAAWLAVALVEEGIRLREGGIDAPILILSEPSVAAVPAIIEWSLTPSVYSPWMVAAIDAASRGPRGVHVVVDTGMHRVGLPPEEAIDLAVEISRSEHVRVEGVWTHLSVADTDPEFTGRQLDAFDLALADFASTGIDPGLVHAANTAGALLFPRARHDMVRLGLGMYGLHPAPATRDVVDLTPAMSVVSAVAHVRRLPAGSAPSYGRRRPLDADATVVTVPVGYADGVPRFWSSGEVLIGGERRPLAGTVTMDQIVVDAGDLAVSVGDEVILIGRQGSEEIGVDDWAAAGDTISYEIVCRVGPRLPRRYHR